MQPNIHIAWIIMRLYSHIFMKNHAAQLLHINIVIIMWWGAKHPYFPWIPNCEVKHWPRYQSCISETSTAFAYKSIGSSFFSNSFTLLEIGSSTSFTSCTSHSSTLSPLYHSDQEVVPLVKSEKDRFPWSFSKEGFMAPLSLHLRTTWTRDASF